MLDMVPDAEQMTTLVGKSLYEIWTQLCALIDENMTWNVCGAAVGKHGPMNINTAEAANPMRTVCERKLHRIYDHLR